MATYFIDQKITPFANQYKVFDSQSGQKGQLVAFVHQKRFALRENILFYSDEMQSKLDFQVKTQKVLELAATYDVLDDQDKLLGRFKKEFSSSLLRSTWQILPAEGDTVIAKVRERSIPKAIARRLWGFIPYIGDLPFFLKYHFDLVDPGDQKVLATYDKTRLFYDHYRLDITDEMLKKIDWRVLVAMGVALDALQSR